LIEWAVFTPNPALRDERFNWALRSNKQIHFQIREEFMKSIKTGLLVLAIAFFVFSLPLQAQDKMTFFAYDMSSPVSPGDVKDLPSGGFNGHDLTFQGQFILFVPDRLGMNPLVGLETFEYNYSINASFLGTYWGKWTIDFGDYGYFEGNFSGKSYPFLDHNDGFQVRLMNINQSGELRGIFHGPDGDEKWVLKLISAVANQKDGSMDYLGELHIQ
jgi:hypothetical protein